MPEKERIESLLDNTLTEFGKSAAAIHFQQSLTSTEFAKDHFELSQNLANADLSEIAPTVRGHGTVVDGIDLAATESLQDQTSTNLSRFSLAGYGSSDEELRRDLEKGFNRQLLWLLVTTFESHERFLKNLYAAIGCLEPELWRRKDLGTETIVSAAGKDTEWYRMRVRSRDSNIDCLGIMSRLRIQMPKIEHYEKTKWINAIHTDYRFWIGVIEAFRHVIVHSNGEIEEDALWGMIQRSTGCSLTGHSEGIRVKKLAVKRFCETDGNRLKILLLDVSKLEKYISSPAFKRFRDLFFITVNYDCMVYSVVCKYFNVKRLWER